MSHHALFAAAGIPVTMFSLWASVFAQAGDIPVEPVLKGVAELGSTFLLGWYLWYTAGKAMPKKDELHSEALKIQQIAFNTAIADARKDYLDRLKQQSDDYRADIKDAMTTVKEMSDLIHRSLSFRPTPEMMAAFQKGQPGGS